MKDVGDKSLERKYSRRMLQSKLYNKILWCEIFKSLVQFPKLKLNVHCNLLHTHIETITLSSCLKICIFKLTQSFLTKKKYDNLKLADKTKIQVC